MTTPRASSALKGYFRYHGVMAPGMLLFRNLRFSAKATWVAAAFLVPLLVMAVSFWLVTRQDSRLASRERDGVAYARAVMPLLDAAQNRRRAATAGAPDLPQAQEAVARAWQGVDAVQQRLGGPLATDEAWKRLQPLHAELAATPRRDSAAGTFAAHTDLVDAAFDLLAEAAEGSGLTLDPDADSYHLMLAGTQTLPQLIEQLGQLRAAGHTALRAGSLPPAQRDRLVAAQAFASARLGETRRALRRAQAANPALVDTMKAEPALAAAERLLARVQEQLLGAAPQGDAEAFVAAANEVVAGAYAATARVLDALDARLDTRRSALDNALTLRLAMVAACIGLAVYLLIAFQRVTQGGIAELGRQLREIAAGNLTQRNRPRGGDEFAQLLTTLGDTTAALRRTVGQVLDGAQRIQAASHEVASASQDLSQRTEQSAAHLQRTSAAMTEIGSTVRQTADSAAGATELVSSNADVAQRGGQVMGEAVDTMEGIRASSSRIGEIVGTIDSLAFQTNILALNAAVEAARAGESGRGFAVVAAEVRALAQRSAASAREIRGLIMQSVERVEGGSRVVGDAGETMASIVAGAERVKSLIAEISAGTRGQTAGLEDIGRSVEQLDAMTQQNAALVEQTAAAAATLRENAERLAQEMAFFRVG